MSRTEILVAWTGLVVAGGALWDASPVASLALCGVGIAFGAEAFAMFDRGRKQ